MAPREDAVIRDQLVVFPLLTLFSPSPILSLPLLAFATLMGEVIILDKAFPEWESASEFLNSHLSRALELDGKRSSHPIEVPLTGENVDDAINQVFDAISYSKGASVLKMLSSLLGEDVFLKGVSIYLKNHLYANSVTKDLWNGISEASGMNVAKIMVSHGVSSLAQCQSLDSELLTLPLSDLRPTGLSSKDSLSSLSPNQQTLSRSNRTVSSALVMSSRRRTRLCGMCLWPSRQSDLMESLS